MKDDCKERVYTNEGNWPLIKHLPGAAVNILDVGCGAGDNAVLLKGFIPGAKVYGITVSNAERERAAQFMADCIVADIELGVPDALRDIRFDAMIFSHVLEHVHHPSTVLASFSSLLRPEGVMLIAVPNVLAWKQRWQFLMGRFEYTSTGIMDQTHLRFFTYSTADRYLFSETPDLNLVLKDVTGSVPLWIMRRHFFPRQISGLCDRLGCTLAPNLFGSQVILVAQKRLSDQSRKGTRSVSL